MDTNQIISQETVDTETIVSEQLNNAAETPDSADSSSDTVTFEDLGLDEYALNAVKRKGFVTPSPIQILAIPRLLNGDSNMIARARTGTGKTAAFGLPIIQNIREKCDSVQALILEPTRELAMQTCAEMQSFSTNNIPRTTVLYGGASYTTQIRDLKRGCEIVVGTPGRVQDHLEKGTLDISKIKYFILDEGDEMLDMGFIEDIENIFKQANPESRILLFSATQCKHREKQHRHNFHSQLLFIDNNIANRALEDFRFYYTSPVWRFSPNFVDQLAKRSSISRHWRYTSIVVNNHDFQFLTRCPSATMYFQTSSTQSNTVIGVYGSPPEPSHTSYIREWNGPNQTRLRTITSRPYRVTSNIEIFLLQPQLQYRHGTHFQVLTISIIRYILVPLPPILYFQFLSCCTSLFQQSRQRLRIYASVR